MINVIISFGFHGIFSLNLSNTFEYSFKNISFLPVVFVIKLQLSKISVNTSKGHSYFEEFSL